VRIRLSSPVVNAEHDGDPATAGSVYVTYLKDGKTWRIKAATCVMACFNAIVPICVHNCPRLRNRHSIVWCASRWC